MDIFQEKEIKHMERNNEALSDIYNLNSSQMVIPFNPLRLHFLLFTFVHIGVT